MKKGQKKIGKNQLTTNVELEKMAEILGFKVIVLSKDELKKLFSKKKSKNGNYIINLQNSDKGFGTHWVALKVYPKEAFYYDSFGIFPPLEVNNYLMKGEDPQNVRNLYVNTKHIQNINGGYCGQYGIDFLRYMNNEKQNLSNLDRFTKYLDMWYARE